MFSMIEENWDDALELLDGIIEEDEANSAARKRKIAIYKSQGDNSKTIQELTRYLKVFMSDQEAWMELCDLYIQVQLKKCRIDPRAVTNYFLLQEQEYGKAAFCCEEVLLQNPHNHLYHQRQADIRLGLIVFTIRYSTVKNAIVQIYLGWLRPARAG